MPLILETQRFNIVGHDNPHHDRDNGGHAKITPKTTYVDRTKMPLDLYLEMMELVLITGEAITKVMIKKGIEVQRINYQDNGNWAFFPGVKIKPVVHVHLYVRSKNEKHPDNDSRFKAFPNALFFPFVEEFPEYYQNFKPYSIEDCSDIKLEIEKLLDTQKYKQLKEKI